MSDSSCLCEKIAGPEVALHPNCFGQTWLFKGVPAEARAGLASQLIRRKLGEGEILFHQGEEADSMYLLKMGSVKLWKTTEDGRTLTLDIRKAGDLLGENVLIEESGEYPVTATCLEPTMACGIDRGTFEGMVSAFPAVGLTVIRNLSKRIDYLTGKLGALSEPSIEERLYKVLVNVAEQVGTPVPGGWSIAFPLTHEEIGFLVGAHRVSITKAMKKLKDLGKVKSHGKHLFVTRAET